MRRLAILAALLIPAMACGQNMAAHHAAAAGIQYSTATATPWYLSGGVSAENCVAAYAAKGAASQAASYDNLASAATNYNLSAVGAVAWNTTNGWSGWTTGRYLDTRLVPSLAGTWSMIAKFDNQSTAATRSVAGTTAAAFGRFFLHAASASGRQYGNGDSGDTLSVAGSVSGQNVMAFAGKAAYLNGASEGTISAGSGGTAKSVFVGSDSDSGGAQINPLSANSYISSIAIYNSTLTSNQVVAIGAAMP